MRGVQVFLRQAEPALDEPGAAAGIDQPAGTTRLHVSSAPCPGHAVLAAAIGEVEVTDRRAIDEAHPATLRFLGEEVLEDAAVDLVARHRQGPARTQLGHAVDVAPAIGEEESEAELLQLPLLKVLLQPQHLGEVVGADLDRRFADLVACGRYRVRLALEHQDVDLAEAAPELKRQRQAGEATAHDDDVVSIVCVVHVMSGGQRAPVVARTWGVRRHCHHARISAGPPKPGCATESDLRSANGFAARFAHSEPGSSP